MLRKCEKCEKCGGPLYWHSIGADVYDKRDVTRFTVMESRRKYRICGKCLPVDRLPEGWPLEQLGEMAQQA